MAYYTIGGSLSHAGEWATHKYIKKIPIGGGKFQYVYQDDMLRKKAGAGKSSANQTLQNRLARNARATASVRNTVPRMRQNNALRRQYEEGVSADRRAANNVGKVTKSSYAIEKQYGMENTTNIGKRQQPSKFESTMNDLQRSANAAYTRTSRRIRQAMKPIISEVKTQAANARDWGTKKMDWAGDQVRTGLKAARTFLDDLVKKITGNPLVKKMARKAVRARDTVYNTFRPKYNQVADHVLVIGPNGNQHYGKSVVGRDFLGQKTFKVRKDTRAGKGGGKASRRSYSTRD